jgi:diamine N-acetyltransferase
LSDLPGRSEAGTIAAWAEARAATGEFGDPAAPRTGAEGAVVELREVTGDSVRAICALQVAPEQRGFVAPNAVSLAEAMFEPKAWFRAIYADDAPVGFAMLHDDPDEPAYHLWRFMIDGRFQGRGYGRQAIALLVDHVRGRPGATELKVSWVPADGGPEPFYRALGFEATGEVDGAEVVGRLPLR